jgi:hypothetical protein
MLTITQTVQRDLTASEKIALDTTQIIDNYMAAMNTNDGQTATQFARILLLKAMTL